MKNILIADDHPAIRNGVKLILKNEFSKVEFGEASNAIEIFKALKEKNWDILILDMDMPGRNGLEVLKQLKDDNNELPVLVFSMHPEEQIAVRALRCGASGYLSKDSASEELGKAVHHILSGRKYITPTLAEQMALQLENPQNKEPHELLSGREYQTLLLIASGKTISQIAVPIYTPDAYIYQDLNFSVGGSAGEKVGIVIEGVDSLQLDSLLLSGLKVSTLMGGVSNNDTLNSLQYTISQLSGSSLKYQIEFSATNNFDAVQLLLDSDIPGSIDSLKVFYAFHDNTALPIELLDFHAKVNEAGVTLLWTTATESNNDHFTAERSKDGKDFEIIGTIKGAGNSLVKKTYSFVDTYSGNGISYYRLKQTDHDGKYKYFKIISTEQSSVLPEFIIYPNPLFNQTLRIDLPGDSESLLILTDSRGEVIFSKSVLPDQARNETDFLYSDPLLAGTYYVKLIKKETVQVRKLIVTK